MPYGKTRRRRRYRRKKNNWARKRSTAAQPRAPIADSQVVKMKYCTLLQLNPGAGTATTSIIRANDAFDPDATNIGHQPYGFDQWSNFYDHITVIGSQIKCIFTPTTATATGSSVCTLHVADDTGTTAAVETLMERTGTVWGVMGALGSSNGLRLTKKFSTKKFFNVTDVKDRSDLQGTFSSSPNDDAYFHISCFDTVGGDADDVSVLVEVEYICLLSERKDLIGS